MKKLEYKEYKVGLSIGLANADQSGTVDPSEEFTEEEWNSMTLDKQRKWLDKETKE